MKTGIFACFILIMAALIGCGGGDKGDSDKIKIVATTGMITDMLENIGGDRVEVSGMMGPGVDPHLYKASAGDVTRMQEADIIFYNGLHLEGAMAELFEKIEKQKTTVAVTAGVDEDILLSPAEYEGSYDPHIWFDVTMWIEAVHHAKEALMKFDTAGASVYAGNAEEYITKLHDLHDYVTKRAGEVPAEIRVLITAHDAFNYFGRAYEFEVRGLQGISTVAEAGTADIRDLADFITERKIPAIFVESSVPKRTIQALQAAVVDRGFEVTIGGELYSDALGNPGSEAGTYIKMVRHNINTIVNGLLGESHGE